MNQFAQDLHYALRRMRKSPGSTVTTVGILALGLGATTVLFSVLHAVLLSPLPYPEAERIYRLEEHTRLSGKAEDGISAPTFREWSTGLESFSALAAIRFDNFNLTGAQEPQQVRAAQVNAEFFQVFSPMPSPGRGVTPEEYGGDGSNVVLLSRTVWLRQFGGREEIAGLEVEFDGQPHTVVGVMPAGFQVPSWADVWLPLSEISGTDRRLRSLRVYGKLDADSNPTTAAVELSTMAQRLRVAHPDSHREVDAHMVSLLEVEVGEVRPTLLMLFGAVVGVLLIVCLNVSGLQLARGLARRRELAVRNALGAGRYRLMREMLTESLLLAALGGAAGGLLAQWGFDLILALAPAGVPRLNEVRLDGPVLAFALGATLLAGLAAGWLPAWSSTRFELDEALKVDLRSTSGRGATLRSALVVGQVALTVVLLASAGLLFGSLRQLLKTEPGYDVDRMLSVGLVLPPNLYPEPHQLTAFVDEVTDRLEALPEVERAVVSNSLPWAGFNGRTLEFATLRTPDPDGIGEGTRFRGEAMEKVVSEGFFEALGVPLLAGRGFNSYDEAAGVEGGERTEAVVINKALMRRAWPQLEGAPLGEQIEIVIPGREPLAAEIVGVVADVPFGGPGTEAQPQVFRAFARNPWNYFNIAVRSSGTDTDRLLTTVRQTVWRVDPVRSLFGEQTASDVLAGSLQRPRFGAVLLGSFAAVALLLAAVGIYGLMSFIVNRRGREIGIRMALGARRGTVRRMVIRQGMILVVLGILLGVPCALAAARLLEGLLYGVSPGDPLILASTLMLLASSGWLAIHWPAARASRIEPVEALRDE